MLRPETTYRLAGRRLQVPHEGAGSDLRCRELHLEPNALEHAAQLLGRLEHVEVGPGGHVATLTVRYSLLHASLEEIEEYLCEQGFRLDNSLYARMVRALVYFTEETERRNLAMPQRLIKQSDEVYVRAYDRHPHGDHDDTPVELRDER
ncbi:hypothetical protein ACDA63_13675 [Uliginosibacterium sp. sgz301328]|uniref:hypothetical protein n=1 Tax=Uliginosibacterium sp. sgz301328 TaxID=3243764 RepID=UPI00359CDC5C